MTKINLLYSNTEIWKEIEGYDGDYFISNFGRVKSFKKCRGTYERILEPVENNQGYFIVGLCKKGEKQKTKKIHILMYETHIEKIPKGYVIHHIDFTKNNYLDNFEMITDFEHRSLHNKGENHHNYGKHPSEETRKLISENHADVKGENNKNSILTEQKVIQIRVDLEEGVLTQTEIAKKFGVSKSVISDIKRRKTWKHI